MVAEKTHKHLVIRWATLKGLTAIILFLAIAVLAEYLIVIYAMRLGVKDEAQLQWSFKFPGTEWTPTIIISPLFHLVPAAVIISLVFSWIYLTKYSAVKPIETQKLTREATKSERTQKSRTVKKFFGKIKSGLLKVKGISYVWQKIHFARATIKSASTVLLVFLVLTLVISLLTYPNLIYQTITNAYKNDPSLLNFVKGVAQFFAPIGGFFSAVNNALLGVAPGFRDFAFSLGLAIKPLADLDNAGKYLVFQNVAAWISALAAIGYGKYGRKSYRYKRIRRS